MFDRSSTRIVTDLILLILVIFGYWYIALPIAIIGAWGFPFYIEIVLLSFVYDALFGLGRGLGVWGYIATITSIAILSALSFLKVVVRK